MKKCILFILAMLLLIGTPAFAEGFDWHYAMFNEGLAPIEIGGTWAYIHTDGSVAFSLGDSVIDCDRFSEGLAAVRVLDNNGNKKYGYINNEGSFVIQPKFDDADDFSQGLAIVEKGGSHMYIDQTGTVVIPDVHMLAKSFNEYNITYGGKKNGRCIYINRRGDVVLDKNFETGDNFTNGYACIEYNDGQYFYMDTEGKFIDIHVNGEYIQQASEEWGFFQYGYAPVTINGKKGMIDTTGNLIIPCEYDRLFNASSDGHVIVHKEGEGFSIIDLEGNVIKAAPTGWRISYGGGSAFGTYGHDIAVVEAGAKVGVIDSNGEWIVQPEYDKIASCSEEGLMTALKGNVVQIIDNDGNILVRDLAKTASGLFDYEWNTSMAEVVEQSGAPLMDGVTTDGMDYIAYERTIAGRNTLAAYYFNDTGLHSVMYLWDEIYSDGDRAMNDYQNINALLSQMGNSIASEQNWDSDSHKSTYSTQIGYALSRGYVSCSDVYLINNSLTGCFIDHQAEGISIRIMTQKLN